MGFKTLNTVKVPSAGLTINVGTLLERPKSVTLAITRYGVPILVELTINEADALSMALAVAYSEALSASPVGVIA